MCARAYVSVSTAHKDTVHFLCLTLDAPLEEGLTALARPDAVVVAGRVVVAHGAVVEVRLPARRHQRLLALRSTPPRALAEG